MPAQAKPASAAEHLRQIKASTGKPQGINTLLTGMPGTKKTNSLRTWPAPILVHCFDKGGDYHLDDEPERITIDRRWMDFDFGKPRTFSDWNDEFNQMKKLTFGGKSFFSQIGTFVIDSLSSFEMCAMAEAVEMEPVSDKGQTDRRVRTYHFGSLKIPPKVQDHYRAYGDALELITLACGALPCHFVLVSHVKDQTDKNGKPTGKLILDMSGRLKTNLYKHFTEVYYADLDPRGNGYWWTQGNNRFIARTNIGPTVFSQKEDQDFKALLKKAGRPFEDLKLG